MYDSLKINTFDRNDSCVVSDEPVEIKEWKSRDLVLFCDKTCSERCHCGFHL